MIFWVPKSLILGIFGYPKNGTSGAKHENPRTVLDTATKTDFFEMTDSLHPKGQPR